MQVERKLRSAVEAMKEVYNNITYFLDNVYFVIYYEK